MRRLLRDTGLLFGYSVSATIHNPGWVLFGLFQPILWLVLFAPVLEAVANVPGFPAGGALVVFTPGLLVILALYGSLYVGFGLVADLRAGVLERLAVTPTNRLALVLGRVLRDVLVLVLQSLLLLALAWLFGLRADGPGMLASLALVGLIGLLTASFSYGLALLVRDENGLSATLNFFSLPLLLLSGVTLPLALAPTWLRAIASVNPFYYAVEAARALFLGVWDAPAVTTGFAVLAVLAAGALLWAARAFRRVGA